MVMTPATKAYELEERDNNNQSSQRCPTKTTKESSASGNPRSHLVDAQEVMTLKNGSITELNVQRVVCAIF